MTVAGWMRVFETVSGLVQMSGRFRKPPGDLEPSSSAGGPLGGLEARLAGVLVAALKEAFDRDRVRMDLERNQIDSERQRAEEALRAELRRQAADRMLGQLRLLATMAFVVLMVGVALGVWLPGMRSAVPRGLMAGGWLLGIGALGCSFAAWQGVSAWSAGPQPGAPQAEIVAASPHALVRSALWLLLGALVLVGGSLLSAL